MATDKPISGFPALLAANVDPDDQLVIVDVTDTSSGSTTGTTKNITLAAVLNNPNNGIIAGILEPARSTPGLGKIVNTAQNGVVFQSTGGTLTDYVFLDSVGDQIAAMRASDSALIGTKFMGVSAVPSVAIGAGAGAGATASVVGSDTCGVITLTTGTGTTIGDVCTLTFSNPYGNSATGIVQYESSDWLLTNQPTLMTATISTGLTIRVAVTALTTSVPYKFNYIVIGYGN